jgi:hypothetical protein
MTYAPFRVQDEYGNSVILTQAQGKSLLDAGLIRECPTRVPGPVFYHPLRNHTHKNGLPLPAEGCEVCQIMQPDPNR